MEGLLIVLSSLISGIIASFITMKFTRENLKTTKYIDTITSERIKWIQLVRSDLTELVSSILIHQKNTDHLNDLIEDKIIQDDEIAFTTHQKESVFSWRKTDFVIEFAYGDGFEVERPIRSDELPSNLKLKYEELQTEYDKIHLEKVFAFGKEPSFEFYCYKAGKLTKFEL